MRLESNQDTGAATVQSGRRKLRPGEPRDWNETAEDTAPSKPHPRGTVQILRRLDMAPVPSPPQLTLRRREHSSSVAVDSAAAAPAPATAPAPAATSAAPVSGGGRSNIAPWQPGLARASSDAYRRPKGTLMDSYDGEDESDNEQQPSRRARRDSSSPNYPRRQLMPGAYSEPSTHRSASVSSYGGDEDEDNGLEVEEVLPDGSSPHSRQHMSSRDGYVDSESDRNRYRKRFAPRYRSDNERESDPPRSSSEVASISHTRESSRVRERSESPSKAHRYQLTHVRESSRPPAPSRKRRAKSAQRDGYRSAESAYGERDHPPQRPLAIRSARSLNGSTSGPARILSKVFGKTSSRPPSPDKFFHVEKETVREKRKGVECVICMEDIPSSKGADLKCGHRMCHACMKRIFEMSIHNQQHMPPRCCTKSHIPLEYVDKLFDDAFKRTWNRKFAEFSTANRVYCPSKRCGEWIKPTSFYRGEDGRRAARCARCKTKWKGCGCPWFNYEIGSNPWENNPLEAPNVSTEDLREILWNSRPLSELGGPYPRPIPSMPVRPRPQTYEDATFGRLQGQLDVYAPRMPQHSDDRHRGRDRNRGRELDWDREQGQGRDRENPFAPISPGVHGDGVPFGLGGGTYYPFEDYRRTSMPTLSATASAAPPPQPLHVGYASEVSRARGPQRSGSMEQRLAERLSENRSGRRSGGPSPPAPTARPHVRGTADTVIGAAPGGMFPLPKAAQPLFPGNSYFYEGMYTTRPISVQDPHYDRGMETAEPELSSPRRRSRRSGEERERPKSSTLAGLTGYGRGVHRVPEWRNFVEPGVPDGE
ncbi:hypothetical protein Trco_003872 [Trichoderma cornu-damae]|uniref:RING-type domain-containing protein n=1 Tax=Trichoderma cornu-damae TaxID=654480 RepID=A0A9P8QLW6_9HYPO|nr:hypothetical protein Trco_003872 [Trichoderma cornu-damae]